MTNDFDMDLLFRCGTAENRSILKKDSPTYIMQELLIRADLNAYQLLQLPCIFQVKR
jgi:hypothetical protein